MLATARTFCFFSSLALVYEFCVPHRIFTTMFYSDTTQMAPHFQSKSHIPFLIAQCAPIFMKSCNEIINVYIDVFKDSHIICNYDSVVQFANLITFELRLDTSILKNIFTNITNGGSVMMINTDYHAPTLYAEVLAGNRLVYSVNFLLFNRMNLR